MIQDLCSRATTAQRQELERYDVPAQRMTDFAKGRRKPSAAQLVTICTVMGVDPVPYLVALSQQTATPAQQRLLGAFKAAAVVLVAVAELCSPSPSSAKSRGYGAGSGACDNLYTKRRGRPRPRQLFFQW